MEKEKISRLLSKHLNQMIQVEHCELYASGFRSDGYRLTTTDGREFFLKHIRENSCMAGGFELPERRLNSLLLSHRIANRIGVAPRSLGVWIDSKNNDPIQVPDIQEDAAIYQIQEFEQNGKAYSLLLEERSEKKAVDEQDHTELEQICSYIIKIHGIRYPAEDQKKLEAVYNDGLLSRLANPELTFAFLQTFEENDAILPPSKQGEYIGLMIQNIRKWTGRSDRLTALHGDFWSGNVFLRNDNSVWAIDYSFVPWGDPGIDIGHWVAQIMWHYHRTKNSYYKALVELFLELYEKKTGDREIRKALCLGYGMMGIVFAAPKLIPHNTELKVRQCFFENTKAILSTGELVWYD